MLTFPDFSLPFILCADATSFDLREALIQNDDGDKIQITACATRVLNEAGSRYSVMYLETSSLAVFRDLIFGCTNQAFTDHVLVTELLKGKKPR